MLVATHGGGGGDVRVLMLSVFPGHPTQVPVLAENMAVQGEEYCTYQEGPRVLPVLKGQGGQGPIVPNLPLPPLGLPLLPLPLPHATFRRARRSTRGSGRIGST